MNVLKKWFLFIPLLAAPLFSSCLEETSPGKTDTAADSLGQAGTINVKRKCNMPGEALFNANCAACHNASETHLTGPGLACARQRVPAGDWLYRYVRNAREMLAAGDTYAVSLHKKFGGVMTTFNLTNQEIDAIFDWIDCQSPCNSKQQ